MAILAEELKKLTPQQRLLLERELAKQGIEISRYQILPRDGDRESYPLSLAQQRLWFLHQLEPDNASHHISTPLRLGGDLDLASLRRALSALVERHESLRTTFPTVEDEPVQVVHPPRPVRLPAVDLRRLPPGARETLVSALARRHVQRPFDLAAGPVLRTDLVLLGGSEQVLLLTMHHIVGDGWSLGIFFRELLALYRAFSRGEASPLAPLPIQYPDFALWQEKHLAGESLDEHLAYWRGQLQGAPPLLELPLDRQRPAERSHRGGSVGVGIPAELTGALKQLARRSRTSIFAVLLAGYQALLHRLTGQERIPVGSPIAGRNREETEGLIGFFVSNQVLVTSFEGDPSFQGLLDRARRTVEGAGAHQDLPFERLVDELKPERSLNHTPLFQVELAFQASPGSGLDLEGLDVRFEGTSYQAAMFDLSLTLIDHGAWIGGGLTYSTDLFDATTARRIGVRLVELLRAAAGNPDLRVSGLPVWAPAELHQLRVEWNPSWGDRFEARCEELLHRRFAARAANEPERPALVFEGERLSYGELAARVSALAGRLRRLGVGPESRVGLCLERSVELVVGIFATLEAGGAWVPLDPDYPRERVAFMLEDAAVSVLVTERRLLEEKGLEEPASRVPATLCLDDRAGEEVSAADRGAPAAEPRPENLAYTIYTSGSTGRPKGAMNGHRAILNRILWMQRAFRLDGSDAVLQKTPASFDVSVWEFLWPLAFGARLVVAKPGGHQDSRYLVELIGRERITTLHFVPSMLRIFLEEEDLSPCAGLRRVIASGEALPAELERRFEARLRQVAPGARLHNLYGPTEAAVDVTWHPCRTARPSSIAPVSTTVPIGRPIDHTRIHVLDAQGSPVPIGVAGELQIGGVNLARGYHGRSALTAFRFVPDGVGPEAGARLYRTGDRVRPLADGSIEFLERLDHQVKVRGFRIELGEIEAALAELPEIRECAVLAREDEPGHRRLVAYLVPQEGEAPGVRALRASLGRKLPEHMVPAAFVTLEELPLTPNGKLDRRALPAPSAERLDLEVFTAPESPAEMALAGVWRDLLHLEKVGVRDNFFEIGGDSIIGLQVVSRVLRLGIRLAPRQIFQHQTIAELAAVAGTAEAVVVEQGPVVGPVPLIPVQHWFFEQGRAEPHHFNQSLLLGMTEPLAPGNLRAAVGRLLVHHDALRSRFAHGPGGWRQEVLPPGASPDPFACLDLSGLGEDDRRSALAGAGEGAQASLDLEAGGVVRALQLRTGGGLPDLLLLAIHHLVVDGVSWRILVEDLEALTASSSAVPVATTVGETELPAKTSSFKLWAERLTGHAGNSSLGEQLELWAAPARQRVRPLPVDEGDEQSGGENLEGRTSAVAVGLTEEETEGLLRRLPPVYRTQVEDALVAALVEALGRWAGSRAVLVDVESHGREPLFDDVDLSRTVGWFTAVHPQLVELPEPEGGAGALLKAVKEQRRAVPDRGIGYGLLRYLGPAAVRSRLAALPQAQVAFNYLGQLDAGAGNSPAADAGASRPAPSRRFFMTGQSAGRTYSSRGRRRYLLEVDSRVTGGRFRLSIAYARGFHREETIQALAEGVLASLRRLIAHAESPGAGGYTPSDFPLAKLGQEALDALLRGDRGVEDVYPLSPMQEGILFHDVLDPESRVYDMQVTCAFTGPFETRLFYRAWQLLVERHPILRTSCRWEGLERPLQVVHAEVEIPLREEDWRRVPAEEKAARLADFLRDDLARGTDLARAPLMRLAFLRLADDRTQLVWNHHHLTLDGWSLPRLFREVFTLYEGLLRGGVPRLEAVRPYRDYIAWLEAQEPGAAEEYWRRRLAGFSAATPLRVERSGPPEQGPLYALHRATRKLSVPVYGALSARARGLRVTANTLVQGAWALLLARQSGESDVVFGATVSGRPAEIEGVESMLGLFINSLPVRTRIDERARLGAWLQRLQLEQAEGRDFEHTALAQVQAWSEVPRGEPLFESLLVFENYPVEASVKGGAPAAGQERGAEKAGAGRDGGGGEPARQGLDISGVENVEQTSFPVTVVALPGESLTVRVGVARSRFDATTGRRLLDHLLALLEAIAERGDVPLGALSQLSAAERHQLRVEWASGDGFEPALHAAGAPLLVHELVRRRGERVPERPALVLEGTTLAYGELLAHTATLARRLTAAGVGPEVPVALCAERSFEMVVGMLAILEAGGAYLPLDPELPRERLAFLLEDALGRVSARVVVAQERFLDRLPDLEQAGIEAMLLEPVEPGAELGAGEQTVPPEPPLRPEHPAYVIYTSGTTGKPKGVVISHEALTNRLLWGGAADVAAPYSYLHKTTISFDVSVLEIFMPLAFGGRVVMAKPGGQWDLPYLMDLIAEQKVTQASFAPSVHKVLLEQERPERLDSLVRLFTAAEAVPPGLPESVYRRYGDIDLFNRYGPTEATIGTTSWRCRTPREGGEAAAVPIGRPIAGAEILLLDAALRPVPVGVPGELLIGGRCLARGYLGRPALTAEKMVPHPNGASGQRLYRTGDLARHRPDGAIEFLGRIDTQVKIRGFRVELGEIESALTGHPAVGQAAVLLREDQPGVQRLVAYTVPEAGAEAPGFEQLRGFLRTELPAYLVPTAFVTLEALPLTPAGKVDRRALPAPAVERAAAEEIALPRSPVEESLTAVWRQVLRLEQVGIHDNFFELGGDSILSLQVISRAARVGIRLSPKQVFEHPTLAELAAVAGTAAEVDAEQGPVVGALPLGPAQQGFFELGWSEPHHFNQSLLLAVAAARHDVLERSLAHLVSHHDALRARFEAPEEGSEGRWQAELAAPEEAVPQLHALDLSRLAQDEAAKALSDLVERGQRSLDLGRPPLLRAFWIDLGRDRASRLLLACHHLVVDGISWRILLEDLAAAYGQLARGEEPRLAAKTTSVVAWAERLAAHALAPETRAELAYWAAPERQTVPLPVDQDGGKNTWGSTATATATLDAAETTELLRAVPAVYHTRVNDVLLAAVARAFAGWTGDRRLLVDLEGHGREPLFDDVDLSRTVGWFTAIYPVLLDLGDLEAGGEVVATGAELKAIKEQLRAVPRNGIGYGLLRFLGHEPDREALGELPRPQVTFNYLGQLDSAEPGPAAAEGEAEAGEPAAGETAAQPGMDLRFGLAPEGSGVDFSPRGRRRSLFTLNASVLGGELRLALAYSKNLHRPETARSLVEATAGVLREILEHCRSPEAGGFTPSDFPLAGLDQAGLDALLAGRRDVADVYPLSPTQQGMLFFSLYDRGSAAYFQQTTRRFRGDLDPAAFVAAWQDLAASHAVLRTGFAWEGLDEPLQIVYREPRIPCRHLDWRGLPAERHQALLEGFLEADRAAGFDLGEAPLARLAFIHLADDDVFLCWSVHHILVDGWSGPLMRNELFQRYLARCTGAQVELPRSRPYRDYIAWLRSQDPAKAEAFWRRELAGFTEPVSLGAVPATTAPKRGAERYGGTVLRVSPEVSAGLDRLAADLRLTRNTLTQAVWALLLARFSGRDDVVFGATVAGRSAPLPGIESMIGLFIATLPVRAVLDPETPASAWMRRLQEHQVEARQLEHTPLMLIQKWSEVPASRMLFESLVVFENYPMDTSFTAPTQPADPHPSAAVPREEIPASFEGAPARKAPAGPPRGTGVVASTVRQFERTSYPLTVIVMPGEGGWSFQIGFDLRIYEPQTIVHLTETLGTLLEGLVAHPEARLRDLPVLEEAERRQMLVEWNATEAPYDPTLLVTRGIRARAAITPHAEALAWEGGALSYAAMQGRVDALAASLRQRGVGPEVPVAVLFERSPEAIVALLAVLEAGGAYLPLDPRTPGERIAAFLADAGVGLALTQEELRGRLPASVEALCLDAAIEVAEKGSREAPASPAHAPAGAPGNLAYLIYTSGSTGVPKAVMVEHRSLSHYAQTAARDVGTTAEDRVLQFASLAFDASVEEIFPSLLQGAALVLRDESMLEPARFVESCLRQRLTVLDLPTAYWHELVATLDREGLSLPGCVRLVILGGERVRPQALALWHALRGRGQVGEETLLVNTYGPTETTVVVTQTPLIEAPKRLQTATGPVWPEVSIGTPRANTQAYLLDLFAQPAPWGAPAELWIGGAGLARGYLGRPALTAERFAPDPFRGEAGARLYRTGDRVRLGGADSLEFLGRVDQQVKVRGFRVELGEIEAALAAHPRIHEAAVVAVGGETVRLAAYAVPAEAEGETESGSAAEPTPEELRDFLRRSLPEYMVPVDWAFLAAVPRTASGKLDRRALPDPRAAAATPGEHQAPETEMEKRLAGLWESLFDRRPIGRGDGFFDLGGDSILALRFLSRLKAELELELPLAALFEHTTVATLAVRLEEPEGLVPADTDLAVALQPSGDGAPLFCVHPSGGTVACYHELAQAMGKDRPFFGIQAVGLDGSAPLASVEAMAERYLEAVREIQPQGPYTVGGWSVGGVAAYEMARRLRAQGEAVSLLALLDTQTPATMKGWDDFELLLTFGATLGVRFTEATAPSRAALRELPAVERKKVIFAAARSRGALAAATAQDEIEALWRVYESVVRAVEGYAPEPLEVPCLLVRAGREGRSPQVDPTLGWKALVPALDLRWIESSHADLVTGERAVALGRLLTGWLRG